MCSCPTHNKRLLNYLVVEIEMNFYEKKNAGKKTKKKTETNLRIF